MGCGGSKKEKPAGDAPQANPGAAGQDAQPATADPHYNSDNEAVHKHVVHSSSADGTIHVGDAITITSGKERFIGTQCIVDGVTDDGRVLVQTVEGKKLSLRSATVTKIEEVDVIASVKEKLAAIQAAK